MRIRGAETKALIIKPERSKLTDLFPLSTLAGICRLSVHPALRGRLSVVRTFGADGCLI